MNLLWVGEANYHRGISKIWCLLIKEKKWWTAGNDLTVSATDPIVNCLWQYRKPRKTDWLSCELVWFIAFCSFCFWITLLSSFVDQIFPNKIQKARLTLIAGLQRAKASRFWIQSQGVTAAVSATNTEMIRFLFVIYTCSVSVYSWQNLFSHMTLPTCRLCKWLINHTGQDRFKFSCCLHKNLRFIWPVNIFPIKFWRAWAVCWAGNRMPFGWELPARVRVRPVALCCVSSPLFPVRPSLCLLNKAEKGQKIFDVWIEACS